MGYFLIIPFEVRNTFDMFRSTFDLRYKFPCQPTYIKDIEKSVFFSVVVVVVVGLFGLVLLFFDNDPIFFSEK